jgi:hypothetical protein
MNGIRVIKGGASNVYDETERTGDLQARRITV